MYFNLPAAFCANITLAFCAHLSNLNLKNVYDVIIRNLTLVTMSPYPHVYSNKN